MGPVMNAKGKACTLQDMINLYVFIKTLNHTFKSCALNLELFY